MLRAKYSFDLTPTASCDRTFSRAPRWLIVRSFDFQSHQRQAAFTALINLAFACCGLTNQSVDQIR